MPSRSRLRSTRAADGAFESLLAIDLGLRTGLAIYGSDGRLQRYRSQHYATQGTLRRAVPGILDGAPSVTTLVIEGGGALLGVWEREAARRGLDVIRVTADEWRPALLLPRDQRSASVAKRTAGEIARRIIAQSAAPRPTSLRHDAAEAILIGYWGAMQMGWIEQRAAAFG